MIVSALLQHRRPTIRFPRPTDVEPGSQYAFYWNGSKAPNGDGIGGDGAPIDYSTRLAGPLPLWRSGHVTLFGGGFGDGGFGEPGAANNPAMGFAAGPFGIGPFGIGGGYCEWAFPFSLRDGIYSIATRILDWLGNERSAADATLTFAVEALPRPATDARFSAYDSQTQTLTFDWRHSPEFQASA